MTRGDIFMLDFGVPFGSEPGYRRPVVIVHSDKKGNVFLPKTVSSLPKDSVALVHQIITVDKFRLEEKISSLPKNALSEIDKAIDYVLKN